MLAEFRKLAAQELSDVLRERIRESYERGRSLREISDDYLALLDIFEENFHVNIEDQLFSEGGDNTEEVDANATGYVVGSASHTQDSTTSSPGAVPEKDEKKTENFKDGQ